MTLIEILSSIDAEIAQLQQARALLAGSGKSTPTRKTAPKKARRNHVMSAEARKRIGDAQRKRWAAQKKANK